MVGPTGVVPMVLGRGEHRRGGNGVAGWVGVSVGTESIGGVEC